MPVIIGDSAGGTDSGEEFLVAKPYCRDGHISFQAAVVWGTTLITILRRSVCLDTHCTHFIPQQCRFLIVSQRGWKVQRLSRNIFAGLARYSDGVQPVQLTPLKVQSACSQFPASLFLSVQPWYSCGHTVRFA